jgi:hypothetical protein
MTPVAVLSALQQAAEVGYIVTDIKGNRVGMVGYIDPDPASQAVWLDGIARPGDTEGWSLVRAAVPVILDEAARAGTVRHIYYDEYVELGNSLIAGEESEGTELWRTEVVIPQYVNIDGVWCTRVTHCLEASSWFSRL